MWSPFTGTSVAACLALVAISVSHSNRDEPGPAVGTPGGRRPLPVGGLLLAVRHHGSAAGHHGRRQHGRPEGNSS